ncbi:hypothetical protein GPECTOR_12g446 [Gonium pectorale]|uniref:Transmembrane protein n=1 Tax=Gonium pectorale TaxID=33097 RepID=A0A150GNR6_GONPE|nr:hypothetical protein GPECTOR_12g446 [Gonium pectorale]|eukprot:KXZ51483.1 hypothetical protein GPECTOR_12g446 [Gonium pectorale]
MHRLLKDNRQCLLYASGGFAAGVLASFAYHRLRSSRSNSGVNSSRSNSGVNSSRPGVVAITRLVELGSGDAQGSQHSSTLVEQLKKQLHGETMRDHEAEYREGRAEALREHLKSRADVDELFDRILHSPEYQRYRDRVALAWPDIDLKEWVESQRAECHSAMDADWLRCASTLDDGGPPRIGFWVQQK